MHLLPGYPKQISNVPLLASVAFYLQFPPGSSSAVIQKDVLASIVKGSLTKISSAINANISSVQVLIADTTTSATTVPTTYPTEKEESKTMYYIIGGGVAGAVALIIVAIVAVWCCKRKNGYVIIMQASFHQHISIRPEHKDNDIRKRRINRIVDTSSFSSNKRVALETRIDTSPPQLLNIMAESAMLFANIWHKSGSK